MTTSCYLWPCFARPPRRPRQTHSTIAAKLLVTLSPQRAAEPQATRRTLGLAQDPVDVLHRLLVPAAAPTSQQQHRHEADAFIAAATFCRLRY
jgi:hypothetical protein